LPRLDNSEQVGVTIEVGIDLGAVDAGEDEPALAPPHPVTASIRNESALNALRIFIPPTTARAEKPLGC
jgi:hypothetical protein